MGRKKKTRMNTFGNSIEEDNNDISGFSDSPVNIGDCVSSFSFDDSTDTGKEIKLTENNINDNHKNKSEGNLQSEITSDNSTTNVSFSPNNTLQNINNELFDNRRTPIANGAAPQIDGEAPSIRRCYILRESTIRKINELKMMDTDINVCVSTIVDLAIDYYHKLITDTQK